MTEKPGKGKTSTNTPGSNLVGDLESIRTLLDEKEHTANEPEIDDEPDADDVPVLQDVVDGAFEVDESPLVRRVELNSQGTAILGDETIKALLGEEWKNHAADILAKAQDAASQAAAEWSPEQTDELGRALKVRLDGIVNTWLSRIVAEGIDDLREHLLDAIDAEVSRHIKGSKKPDGS